MGLCTRCRRNEAAAGSKACATCRDREKRYEQAKKDRTAGTSLCKRCEENERIEGRVWCVGCASYMQDAKTKTRAKGKADGLCSYTDCKSPATPGYLSCADCRDHANEYGRSRKTEVQWQARQTRRRRRLEVFEAYGGAFCACCGEDTYEFLTMDHINGDGASHRRELGNVRGERGMDIYFWLRRNNFPPGFRVLCMNCNFSLGYHGYCPHRGWTQDTSNGRAGRPSKKNKADVSAS